MTRPLAIVPLVVLLVMCGAPAAPAPSPTRDAAPRSGPVPPPAPDPAAVAAGAPLRAILLAQIDEFERTVCAATPTPGGCVIPPSGRVVGRELAAYAGWWNWVVQCHYDPTSPTGDIFSLALYRPKPAALREPWPLDVYVSGADWCGKRGPVPPGTPAH